MIIDMREVNLNGIDLNLLPALEALLRRRSVTKAAGDVGLSQPAMSRALARLRDLLGDPLLVRTAHGFVLTQRAQSLVPRLHGALEQVRGVLQERAFDPLKAERIVRIAATDTQTILIAPALMARLAVDAPGISLRLEPYGADLIGRMENGSLDLVFAISTTPLPAGALSEPIARDELALVMRKAHPAAAKTWTLQDYGLWDHVGIAILGDGQSDLDTILAAAGVRRRIALVTPHFAAALAAVSSSDLVTTVSRTFAKRFAATFDLCLRKPPFEDISLDMTLVWSGVRGSDPVLAWVRGLIREVAGGVFDV
ncbi:MAG: LysR family transcriptional regulator [Caulobacterales bacterium]|jgi:DNA-binding transcriptional LysR family regulator